MLASPLSCGGRDMRKERVRISPSLGGGFRARGSSARAAVSVCFLTSWAVAVTEAQAQAEVKEHAATPGVGSAQTGRVAPELADWEVRLVAPTVGGPAGLLHTETTDVGRPLSLRVASHAQLFSQRG